MPQFLVTFLTFITGLIFTQKTITTTPPDPVADRLSRMTLEQQIRQTLICGYEGRDPLPTLKNCSNLLYSRSNLNGLSDQDIAGNNLEIHKEDALSWIMIDQEGGQVARIKDGSPSPRKMAQDNTITYWGQEHGKILKNLGFNIDLAPVADVTENNPVINTRSFADDPVIDGQKATEYMKALQSQGIIGVVKHLPGHGRVDNDTHKKTGSLDYSWDEIKNFDLVPFINTINNGARLVMIGHISIPEIDKKPASISPIILGKLRESLPYGNDLVFITDSLSMNGVGLPQDQAAIEAFKAGEDMVLIQGIPTEKLFSKILTAYQDGTLSQESLKKSVYRILKIKTLLN